MKRILAIVFIFCGVSGKIAAQQNWAAIPCFKMKNLDVVNEMMVDSLHNEIILFSNNGNKICNTNYKGLFAYDGAGFHDLDKGVDTQDSYPSADNAVVWDCITYGNKTLFGGWFNSVGSSSLYAKSVALWNGAVWDTFPKHIFRNVPSDNTGGGFYGFVKWNGKLWMYGGFEKIGNTVTTNLVAFDGNTFTPVPAIPVDNNAPITKMIVYKNKLIATGIFYDSQNPNWFRLAQFDGTNWSPVGSGVQGGIGGVWDMQVYKDTLYIAGNWSKAAGNVSNYLMKWDGNQLYDAGFGDYCGWGLINTLVPFKNRLYAFGGFRCAANQKAFGVAYYENGAWTVPQDSISNGDLQGGAVLYNDAIYIGGFFKSINGDTTIQKFAKLICPDFDAASGCLSGLKENSENLDIKVFPNPSNGKLNIEFDGINVEKMTIQNTLGLEVYKLINPSQKQEIDISQLPVGIYFLKAENKQGQGVFKVVKE